MRLFFAILLAGLLVQLPVSARGAEKTSSDKIAAETAGMPQVIPHPVSDSASGDICLKCHGPGKVDAPATSHPERKNCTQCHVRGATDAQKPVTK